LRARSRLPAVSRRPRPADQMVLADMLDERCECSVAIARRILNLRADLAERLAFPSHLVRGEMPDRVARNAGRIEVGLQVADRTAHGRESKSVSPTPDRRLMQPSGVSLTRAVAGRVAVHTARVCQHLAEFRE